jgi:hypothetical protein
MVKQTKYLKKRHKLKNKTKKYYSKGGSILGMITPYIGTAATYAKDKGLRLLGLQPIQSSTTENPTIENPEVKVDNEINKIGDTASGIISDVGNVVNKGSAAVISNINDVLENPKIGENVGEAAAETAAIGTQLLENVTEKLNSPEVKAVTEKALENVADYAEMGVKALDKPLDSAIDEINKAGQKAVSGAVSGAIKVGTDAMSAIPGVGAIISLGKVANDTGKAVSDVVSGVATTTSTVANLVTETSQNFKEELEEKKKEGNMIGGRINKSINYFLNKTKHKGFNRKAKSKKVRFLI